MGCVNVTTNASGLPYLTSTNITVSDTAVDIALGFRRIQPVGLFAVRVANAIPTGTTATLPITITLNGTARALTLFDGTPATVADVTGTGALLIFNDRFNGILQLLSRTTT